MLRQLRILLAIVRGRLAPQKASVLSPYTSILRVWPLDVDVSNVNQSLYFYYLELARWEWIFGSQIRGLMKEFDCLPITATQNIRHLKPLKRFESFQVKSQLTHWDEKWLYIDHTITRGPDLIAVATIKGLFKTKNGSVPTAKLLEHVGLNSQSPPLPPRFQLMADMERDSIEFSKKNP